MSKNKKANFRFKDFDADWKTREIGEILTEKYQPILIEDEKEYQLVTVRRRNEGVVSRGYLKGKNILVKNYFEVNEGDFIISKRQIIHGASGIVPKILHKAVVSNEYLIASSNENISSEYLTLISTLPEMHKIFFLSSYGVDIEKMVFDVRDWKKRSITIPEINEQKRITDFFQEIDQLITQYQQKNSKLKALKKAMLSKMFPKQGQVVPEIRFKGFEDEWESHNLKSLCESIEYGLNAASKPYDGTNKYLRITDIDDDTRDFVTNDITSPNIDLANCNNFLLQKGDVLFARTGASVGKTYVYQEKDGKVYYAGFLIRARIKKGINYEFIFQYTLTEKYNKYIRVTSQRSGQPGVNAQEYGEFTFHLPKNEIEQKKIGNYFKNLDELIGKHEVQITKLQNIKKAFLAKMFI